MILSEQEASERLESPLNLLNRLRSLSSPNGKNKVTSPLLPPQADDIIDDLQDKLNQSSIRSKATSIMLTAMDELQARVVEVSKPEQLARVAESMSKIIESQTIKEKGSNKIGTVVIYSPQMMTEKDFGEVIDVSSRE